MRSILSAAMSGFRDRFPLVVGGLTLCMHPALDVVGYSVLFFFRSSRSGPQTSTCHTRV